MGLSKRQAALGGWFIIAMTVVGGFVMMFSFLALGLGGAVLSALIFVLASILFLVIAIMYIGGDLRLVRVRKSPDEKSKIISRMISIRNSPFNVKKGRGSDLVLGWKVRGKDYVMKIWLDEKTSSCKFTEEVREGRKLTKLGSRYGAGSDLKKKEKSIFIPGIWPVLTGERDIEPEEVRRRVWNICDECGWRMVRK